MTTRSKRVSEMSDEEWAAYDAGEWDGEVNLGEDLDELEEIDYEQEDDTFMHPTIAGVAGFLGYTPKDTTPATPTPTSTTSYTTYEKCRHSGLKAAVVLTLGNGKKFEIAGGSGMATRADDQTRLILDLAGNLDDTPWVAAGPPAFIKELQWRTIPTNIPVLRLNWSDRMAPPVGPEWWETLLDLIAKHYESGRITVACIGGHGRTGTAIASMILAADPTVSAEKAIEMVRDNHCESAIESASQLWYLYDMRPDEEMAQMHKDEINPPKPVTPITTPITSAPTGTSNLPSSKWCTWNTWCMKDRYHSGKCKGRGRA